MCNWYFNKQEFRSISSSYLRNFICYYYYLQLYFSSYFLCLYYLLLTIATERMVNFIIYLLFIINLTIIIEFNALYQLIFLNRYYWIIIQDDFKQLNIFQVIKVIILIIITIINYQWQQQYSILFSLFQAQVFTIFIDQQAITIIFITITILISFIIIIQPYFTVPFVQITKLKGVFLSPKDLTFYFHLRLNIF